MSIAYINIGSSCETYGDSLPSENGIVLTNGTSVLNSSLHTTSGYTVETVGSRTSVFFPNYKFDVSTDRNLVLNSNVNANRYLSPAGTAAVSVDKVTATKRIGVSGVTYSYLGTTYTRNATASAVASVLRNLMSSSVTCISSFSTSIPSTTTINYTTGTTAVGLTGATPITYTNTDAGGTASVTNAPLFYVRLITGDLNTPVAQSTNVYFKSDGTTTDLQTIGDIASTITTGNNYKFFVAPYTTSRGTENEVITIGLYNSSTGARITLLAWAEGSKCFKDVNDNNYALDVTNPLDDIVAAQNTLIKTGTNTYLYWNTYNPITPASSTISATGSFATNRDYWASGPANTTELGIRTIFNWFDLTANKNGGYNDVYRWGFLDSISSYFFYLSGTTPTFSTTVPPANEGWAILYDSTAGSPPGTAAGFLVYVRGGNVIGYFDSSGNIVTSGSGLPLAQASAYSTLNAAVPTARIYKCSKCSGALSGGLCPA